MVLENSGLHARKKKCFRKITVVWARVPKKVRHRCPMPKKFKLLTCPGRLMSRAGLYTKGN